MRCRPHLLLQDEQSPPVGNEGVLPSASSCREDTKPTLCQAGGVVPGVVSGALQGRRTRKLLFEHQELKIGRGRMES